MILLGVDGCRAGWIAASSGLPLGRPDFQLHRSFAGVLAAVAGDEAVVCVDIPIGLVRGRRLCDVEARELLGHPRASSVFTPPCRDALVGRTAEERRALNLRSTGRSLSAQALGILPKIAEVDRSMTATLQAVVREVHPEVVFAALSPSGQGLTSRKKSSQGREERLALLPPALAAATANSPRFAVREVAPDDYVDVLSALVAADRLARGVARRLPASGGERDERGLSMEIWF